MVDVHDVRPPQLFRLTPRVSVCPTKQTPKWILSVDRTIAGRNRWAQRGTDYTGTEINWVVCLLHFTHFTRFTTDLLSDLLAVVVVLNQEVLLKHQPLLPIFTLDQ